MGKLGTALLLAALLWIEQTHASPKFEIAVFDDQQVYFDTLLRESDCPSLRDAQLGDNLMLAEYLLVCNLILEQFPEASFELVGLPIVARVAAAIESGDADISGFGIWSGEAQDYDLHKSTDVMRKGDFSKGLFTIKSRIDQLNAQGPIELTKLVAVSNRNWTYDWAALRCAGMNVAHVSLYEQMFKLVQLGRADVLPMGFGKTGELSKTAFGIKLYPIPGVKLEIPDSSHFLVSNKSEHANKLLTAVDQGLNKMRDSGELMALQTRVGAINAKTRQWRSICEENWRED